MRTIISLLLMTLFIHAGAQQRVTRLIIGEAILENELPHEMLFAFPELREALLVFTDASQHRTSVNINLYTGDLLFLNQYGRPLVLDDTDIIDRIAIDDEVWIPIENTFGEVVYRDGPVMLVRVKRTTVTDHRKESGFGMMSSTASVSSASSVITQDHLFADTREVNEYDFETRDRYRLITPRGTYTAEARGFFRGFRGVNRRFVNNFVEENQIDFSEEEDLITLLRAVMAEQQ